MEKIRKYCSEKNKKFHGCFMVRIGIVRCSLFSITPKKSHRNFIKIYIYVMLRGSNCFKMFYSYGIPYLESHLNIISSFSVPLRLWVCSSYLFIFLLSCFTYAFKLYMLGRTPWWPTITCSVTNKYKYELLCIDGIIVAHNSI